MRKSCLNSHEIPEDSEIMQDNKAVDITRMITGA